MGHEYYTFEAMFTTLDAKQRIDLVTKADALRPEGAGDQRQVFESIELLPRNQRASIDAHVKTAR